MPASSDATSDLRISVIVCARNAKARIGETLVSLRHQSMAAHLYEVVVVDNNSDDGSAEWLEAESRRLGFLFFSEKELGLSAARNRGIRESKGELLYFIDDDAIAPAHLLETLWMDFVEQKADIVGGAVHGLWEDTPPGWLRSEYWRGLSLLSYGTKARRLVYPEILIGCNMGFRKSVFDRFGLFDPTFGRKGDNLVGNEERHLEKQIMEGGGVVYYNPAAYVFHKVPVGRMGAAYFARRTREGAISNSLMEELDGRAGRFASEPLPKRMARKCFDQGRMLLRAVYRSIQAARDAWKMERLLWKSSNEGRRQVRQNRRKRK